MDRKNYAVFGAAGSIGKAVVRELLADSDDHSVCAFTHSYCRSVNIENYEERRTRLSLMIVAVENRDDLEHESNYFSGKLKGYPRSTAFDGIIYTVGHCPPDGFPEAIRYPLSQLPVENYLKEIQMHQIGALNVFQVFLKNLNDGGCFLFLSSAITRLKGQFPPFLQCYHYASAIASEDWLIEGMRNDPAVIERGIKIHRIAPAAVDTPFHRPGPKPPRLIPMSEVVEEIVAALQSDIHVDKMIL